MSKVQIFKDYEEFITFIDDNNSNINGVSQEWLNKTGLTLETLNLVNCEQCWCCKDCEDCW